MNKEEIKENMYRIGIFSMMNKVTVKTLRHYDDLGLLKPSYIDEANGYRYYEANQIPILHEIISLKQLGVSLEEIKKIQEGASLKEVLHQQKVILLKDIADKTLMLSNIEAYMMSEQTSEEYNIVIKSLPKIIVGSKRVMLKSYADLFSVMPKMGLEMEALGCVCQVPSYCFNIYHDGEYREENIDAEVCEAVTELKESETICFKEIEQVDFAACIMHKGPYETLPKSYNKLVNWIEHSGYEAIDYPRESFIDGIWNKDSEEEWLTEIQFPVQKRK